jgi:hypothetical protein
MILDTGRGLRRRRRQRADRRDRQSDGQYDGRRSALQPHQISPNTPNPGSTGKT